LLIVSTMVMDVMVVEQ